MAHHLMKWAAPHLEVASKPLIILDPLSRDLSAKIGKLEQRHTRKSLSLLSKPQIRMMIHFAIIAVIGKSI